MNTDVPLVVLDVDGVIAPVGGLGEPSPGALAHWKPEELVRGDVVWMIQPALDLLRELHASGRVEIVWHTSWREMAQLVLGPTFSLPRWELLPSHQEWLNSAGWWKWDALQPIVESGRRVLWLDDDIADSVDNGEIPASFLGFSNLKIVCPEVNVGLTPEDLNFIRAAIGE